MIKMVATISTHNGSKVARQHNLRNEKVVTKEPHIDLSRQHETWHDEPPRTAYKRLFGDAVNKYNEKQKRDDRKVKDYYKDVCNDKKKHPVYEMIVGVYGSDIAVQTQKEILRSYVDEWKERNPNLELIGAYYHEDEASPHVHIDYIPVAHGYTRGIETQTGLVKALGEMGFEKHGRETAQIQWERRENERLESLCNEHGIEVLHPRDGREHLDKDKYIATQELNALKGQINALEGHVRETQEFRDRSEKKTVLGRRTGVVEVPIDEYMDAKATMREIEDIEQQRAIAYARADDAKEKLEEARKYRAICVDTNELVKEKLNEANEKLENIDAYIRTEAMKYGEGRLQRLEEYCTEITFKDGTSVLERFEEQEAELEHELEFGDK